MTTTQPILNAPTRLGAPAQRLRWQRGFTIVEAMVAVGILGVLTAIGAPAMSEFYERQKLNMGAEAINLAMSTARATALNDLVEVKVCWNPGTTSKTVDGVAIAGGQMVVYKTSPVELISNFTYNDTVFVDDTEGDDCAQFDTQGRLNLTSITGSSLMFGVCRKASDTKDSRNVTVKQTGRALSRPNKQSDGTVLINCQ